MTSTLTEGPVAAALSRMYAESDEQGRSVWSNIDRSVFENGTAQERADAADEIYMPIAPDAGKLMYSLIRAARPAAVVEFGMSYGVSTIHLAAAVRDNGTGHVYTTELSAKKIATATATFAELGLADVITVLEGDALTTLRDVPAPVGVVLMDGWKEMYLPVLDILEPKLVPGSIVVADNTSRSDAVPYLDRVREPANGYVSLNFPGKGNDTMELSCRV
ncbi:MAG: class I SAM-dependent methyltransferase [Mycobacterium sp.]